MFTNPDLRSKIDSLWDKFWSGGISNPLTAIEQMSHLIFLKRLENICISHTVPEKRKLELADLYEEPFTNLGMNAVEKLFGKEEVDELINLTKKLVA